MRWLSDLPRCRIVAFGYDASGLEKLEDLIDPKRLINCAKALLHDYPLRAPPETSTSSVQGSQEIKKGTAAASYTSIGAEQPADETPDGNGFPVDIGRPALFVAHGFGGLIYEQACALSQIRAEGLLADNFYAGFESFVRTRPYRGEKEKTCCYSAQYTSLWGRDGRVGAYVREGAQDSMRRHTSGRKLVGIQGFTGQD